MVTQESPRLQTLSNRQETMLSTSDNMSQATSTSAYHARKINMEDTSYMECCGPYRTVLSEYRIRARGGRQVGSRRRGVSRSAKGFGGTWWW